MNLLSALEYLLLSATICSSVGAEAPALIPQKLTDAVDAPAQAIGSGSKLLFPTNTRAKGLRGLQSCDPNEVVLADYPQWQAEEGYWIGEYSFYQADGTPNFSDDWPYPYDTYRGFITGNVEGNKYRQRNVFFYPPEPTEDCKRRDGVQVVGDGKCGMNGNSLVFFADQQATTCSDNEELAGDIEGDFAPGITTTTELIGDDNALLYQVFFDPVPGVVPKKIIQSQLTTITKDPDTDTTYRTRNAQSFSAFAPPQGVVTNASFFRERKVTKEEFYAEMRATIAEYNILESDLCFLNGFGRAPVEGYVAGFDQCEAHLESSFDL